MNKKRRSFDVSTMQPHDASNCSNYRSWRVNTPVRSIFPRRWQFFVGGTIRKYFVEKAKLFVSLPAFFNHLDRSTQDDIIGWTERTLS